jgi:hypothetical protein
MTLTKEPDAAAWPVQPGSGQGRSHGTSAARPFDRWFRYPAGFASDYVALLLDRMNIDEGLVLDCFMGSGVTGTAAHARGLDFAGIEAHPLIAELATIKLRASVEPGTLRLVAAAVVAASNGPADISGAHTRTSIATPVSTDATTSFEALSSLVGSETELVRRSFPMSVLADLVRLRTTVKGLGSTPESLYLKWSLLATLRDVADVKVGWPYQRPAVARLPRHGDVMKRFLGRVEMMASDLESSPSVTPATHISIGDSSNPDVWSSIPAAQGCVTSPPYLNNFDYADATRLELYFWGEVRTWRQMCEKVRADMLTATTQQSSVGGKATATEKLRAEFGVPGAEVVRLTKDVRTARDDRGGRTKEYDQVVPAYFGAMGSILGNLHKALDAGSTALWLVGDSAPYGVYIDTPRLIGKFAEHVGFEYKEDVLLRRRGNRWSRPMAAELSERMIILRKP